MKHVHNSSGQECYKKKLIDTDMYQEPESKDISPLKMPVPLKQHTMKGDKSAPNIAPMDWKNYHRLEVIHSFIDNLECEYTSICTSGVIGQSLEGRDLKILKISNSNASNSCVWMDAGIHAREWIAPAVATYIADNIARNFDTLSSNVTNKDWYFLPVMNPDGYEYSHTSDRMWRKNKAWHGGQCVGVDLNRNFSYGWGGKGSSNVPSNAFYRGPEPFSEPESTAVRDILSSYGIPFKVYITLHSYGQVIIFPFAFRDELCPDYVRLLEGATVMTKAIHEYNGNTYKVGISRDVMAAGTSNDWSYGAAGIPYCYLIELRSKQHKFRLPKEEIAETGNEMFNCLKALMEFVDNRSLDKFGDKTIR
ncbi:LOW QUALITY PROTEIN: carboxypeptidase B-like [Aphomia sociella]